VADNSYRTFDDGQVFPLPRRHSAGMCFNDGGGGTPPDPRGARPPEQSAFLIDRS
jgi:hypothetical protein